MRYRFALALALTALFVAACGGGGGSSGALPPSSGGASGGSGSDNSTSAVTVALTIKIPNAPSSTSSARRPSYVSPGTQSIGVVVTNQGATPSPAQYVNVSSCPQVSGVTTCSVSVTAMPGADTFAVTAYSGTNGGGSALSTGSITYTVVGGVANVTDTLTLGGVIASISITPGISALPLGQTTTLNVVAKDATGATIVGAYDNPIALGGTNLTFSSTSLANSTAASSVTVGWGYGFAGTSSRTITATGDSATGTLALAPATGMAYYETGTNSETDNAGFKMIAGSNGDLYYTSLGVLVCTGPTGELYCTSVSGAVHQFNPTTDTDTEVALQSEGVGLFFSSDGALWIAGGTQPTQGGPNYIYRMAPGSFSSGALTPIAVPTTDAQDPPAMRAFAQDGLGYLWFVDAIGGRYMSIPVAGPYTSAPIAFYDLPGGPSGTPQIPFGFARQIAYAGNVLSIPDTYSGAVDVINPSPSPPAVVGQYLSNLQASFGAAGVYDSADAYDGTTDGTTVYIANLGNWNAAVLAGDIEAFNPSTDAFTTLPIVQGPNGPEPGAMGKSGNLLYYQDFNNTALGLINVSSDAARLIPIPLDTSPTGNSAFFFPNGVAAMPDGTAWFTCYGEAQTFQPLCIGHTVYLSGWSVWPSSSISVIGAGTQAAQIMGIMEAPSSNSGPFTETSSNTSVCQIASASDHNFMIVGQSAGACTVTVKDASGTTQTVNVTVTTTSGTVQKRRRGGIL
ncbi:MAG TPA: hypothetical protein VMD47_07620 [Candidatus Acidoferrales bacterium]|nr:hypothetical protein [Candidatus Acidoferrales bacterium]